MIRLWCEEDGPESYAVFVDAVHNGADAHYTSAQRAAWVPSSEMEDWWVPRLSKAQTWVSSDGSRLTGLIALTDDGYLDMFFVAPHARGDGTAVALYDVFLKAASEGRHGLLTTHASDYLKPFLEKRGWRVLAEEMAERGGVTLRRWAMSLDQAEASHRS